MSRSDYADGGGTGFVAESYTSFDPVQGTTAVLHWSTGTTTTADSAVRLVRADVKPGIAPELYFKYVKKKFTTLQRMKIERRLKKLEAAFNKAVESGQNSLGEKMLLEMVRETKESMMLARGIQFKIDKAHLDKHKRNIRGGHISDTRYEKYTRVIPDDVVKRKKEVEDLFDGFIIYHVWDEEAEKKRSKNQKMSDSERANMRDPVLFGYINECNDLYFVADWEDEYCDLTFDELVDHLGGDEEEYKLKKNPEIRA